MITRLLALVLALLVSATPASAQTPERPRAPAITASGGVLYEPADGVVLSGLQEVVPRAMASTTKVMTVLLALEAGTADDVVTVSAHAAAVGRQPGAATLNLGAGQQIAMRSLLAGLMLRSGNDAAVAVAEHVAGSEAAFVARMNARAAELDLTATHFVDVAGLTADPAHHASPLDLARLADVAMAIPAFAAWAGAATLAVPGIGLLRNRNELLFEFPGATGVKTGYTNVAGECLIASATRDGRTLYAVVLDSERGSSFSDSAAMLSYGFESFRRPVPVPADAAATSYHWGDAAVPLVAESALARTVPVGATTTWRTVLEPAVDRPVAAGARLGEAQLLVDGTLAASTPLLAATAVPAPRPASAASTAGAAFEEALRAFARLVPVERAA